MSCKEMEQHWQEGLRGGVREEFAQHLRECRRCRELAAELASTSDWVSALRLPPPEPGPVFWARLRQRLEESERGEEFWTALAWAASRTAAALAVVVLVLSLWLLREPPVLPAEAAFDAPQSYLDDTSPVPVVNGQLDRDQVVLTLVSQQEPQP